LHISSAGITLLSWIVIGYFDTSFALPLRIIYHPLTSFVGLKGLSSASNTKQYFVISDYLPFGELLLLPMTERRSCVSLLSLQDISSVSWSALTERQTENTSAGVSLPYLSIVVHHAEQLLLSALA
jgi:hypothetical protein